MNTFVDAATNGFKMGTTENGAVTNLSSGSMLVDLFFKIGASRSNPEGVLNLFADIMKYGNDADKQVAFRIALWARDCRGGAGERKIFSELVKLYPAEFGYAVPIIAEVGRADDLLTFFETGLGSTMKHMIATFYLDMLHDSKVGGLFAKWAPRKGRTAAFLTKAWGLTDRQYRKLIVGLSNTVEQKMCSKNWEAIEYSHVPSVAMSRYMKAFHKNDSGRFTAFRDALEKGETTIHAGQLFPHDIIRTIRGGGDAVVAEAQWNALPNFLGNATGILPMVDVSGSMDTPISGSITAMDVSIALGTYIAQRTEGAFNNLMLTFTDDAHFVKIPEHMTMREIPNYIMDKGCGYSTDFRKAYEKILQVAKNNKVPQEDMPKYLLVLSDMEFNGGWFGSENEVTALEDIRIKFAAAGYKMPVIVFWNLNSRNKNYPAKTNDAGVCLVSGFSPAILKTILATGVITPESVMMDAVMKERYNVAGLTV